jgi:hypothetical protein
MPGGKVGEYHSASLFYKVFNKKAPLPVKERWPGLLGQLKAVFK